MILLGVAGNVLAAIPVPVGSGVWEGSSGAMRFYPDHDYTDPLVANRCSLRLGLEVKPGFVELKELFSACSCPAFIFSSRLSSRLFSVGENGWLYDSSGVAGRLSGNVLELDYVNFDDELDDGVHHVRLEFSPQGVSATWQYDSSIRPAFAITSGDGPLQKME